jgi:hypothetical protein
VLVLVPVVVPVLVDVPPAPPVLDDEEVEAPVPVLEEVPDEDEEGEEDPPPPWVEDFSPLLPHAALRDRTASVARPRSRGFRRIALPPAREDSPTPSRTAPGYTVNDSGRRRSG